LGGISILCQWMFKERELMRTFGLIWLQHQHVISSRRVASTN
jgi:hypothetical protein